MKKFLSLLAFAMTMFTTAWADDMQVSWTTAEGGGFTASANPSTAASDIKYTVGSGLLENGTTTCDNVVFVKFDQNTGDNKGANGKHDQNVELGKYVDFTFTPLGGNFTPTKVSFDVIKVGTGDPNIDVDVVDASGKTIAVASNVVIRKNSETSPSISQSFDVSGAEAGSGAVTLRIIPGKLASGKAIAIANVVVEGTIVSSGAPVLGVSPQQLTFRTTPWERSQQKILTLSGRNLADGTYAVTVPNTAGLSIEPISFTVAEGSVSQEFTVTYTSEADVEPASTDFVFSVGEVSAAATINYSSKGSLTELKSINADIAWDFEQITATKELNKETIPSSEDWVVYADYEDIAFPEAFDAEAIAFKGQYPTRNKKVQNGTLKFKTTVPGTITVDFSDTGSSAGDNDPQRYLYVNGTQTEYYTQRNGKNDRKVSGEIAVPAGEVTICGWNPEAEVKDAEGAVIGKGAEVAICVYKVTFTAGSAPEPAEVTFDFSDPNFRNAVGEAMTDVKGYIYNETFVVDNASLQITAGSAPSRIYVDSNRGQCLVTYKEYTTLTFSAPEGYAITKIDFTAAGNSNINYFSASTGEIEGMTWTGNAEGVRFAQGGTSYLAKAVVTLLAKDDATTALPAIVYTECDNIAAFNALEAGTYAKVTLTDVEVTGVSADGYSTAWIQDATGGCWIQYTSLNAGMKEMTKGNGYVYVVKRLVSGNPQMKETEDTPNSEIEGGDIDQYTMVEGTIAEVNVAENLNKVVKISGATLEETSATAGKLTQGDVTIDVNNGIETANQQLHKIADWAKGNKLEDVTVVAILVAKSATANQLLPISIEEGTTTGISDINATAAEQMNIFNVQGVRLNQLQRGLNIVNGRKVVVK